MVLLGDHSWALRLEESQKDLEYINSRLKGNKIFVKGNHDLWWSTMNKLNSFVKANRFDKISFLFNNAFLVDGMSICGTRGWIRENGEAPDQKVLLREAGRLEADVTVDQTGTSKLEEAQQHIQTILKKNNLVNEDLKGIKIDLNFYLTDVLQRYGVKRCYYAHLHGGSIRGALNGEKNGIEYRLVSADGVGFDPVLVESSARL